MLKLDEINYTTFSRINSMPCFVLINYSPVSNSPTFSDQTTPIVTPCTFGVMKDAVTPAKSNLAQRMFTFLWEVYTHRGSICGCNCVALWMIRIMMIVRFSGWRIGMKVYYLKKYTTRQCFKYLVYKNLGALLWTIWHFSYNRLC